MNPMGQMNPGSMSPMNPMGQMNPGSMSPMNPMSQMMPGSMSPMNPMGQTNQNTSTDEMTDTLDDSQQVLARPKKYGYPHYGYPHYGYNYGYKYPYYNPYYYNNPGFNPLPWFLLGSIL
jgi:hypothetical protein